MNLSLNKGLIITGISAFVLVASANIAVESIYRRNKILADKNTFIISTSLGIISGYILMNALKKGS